MAASAGTAELDPLPKILRKIPKACFQKQPVRAFGYLLRDLVLVALLVAAILWVHSWLIAPILAALLGAVLTGLFVIGHDAGHRSFSNSERVNNVVGTVATAATLWPFHVWRLSHDHHHRWTHHSKNENAWRQLTTSEYGRLSPLMRYTYDRMRTTWFFLASTLFQYFYVADTIKGKVFDRSDAPALRESLRFTLAVGVVYAALATWAGGAYGFLWLFLVPQLVFQMHMSTFTLLHHTSPETEVMAEGVWSPEKAQLGSSIHVRYPALVDWLTHDISWHIPHHVCVGVPHYHLRAATRALTEAYPEHVRTLPFSFAYLRRVLDRCHLIGSHRPGEQGWIAVSDPSAQNVAAAVNALNRHGRTG